MSGIEPVSPDIAAIRGVVGSTETVGPFSYLNPGGEQDVVEEIASTRRRVYVTIDLSNMTKSGTIRVFRKVDGITYQLYTETVFSVGGVIKVFDAQFTTNQDWKLTYLGSSNEGAPRAIPFNTIVEVIE